MGEENTAQELTKSELIGKFRINDKDSGSPEVQIALMTNRLERMAKHFTTHGQDLHSQRGMMRMISRRKKLLQYLKDESPERYRKLIASLGLRK